MPKEGNKNNFVAYTEVLVTARIGKLNRVYMKEKESRVHLTEICMVSQLSYTHKMKINN